MTSQKQIDTNRRNALLSTGPRTEEGRKMHLNHRLATATIISGAEIQPNKATLDIVALCCS